MKAAGAAVARGSRPGRAGLALGRPREAALLALGAFALLALGLVWWVPFRDGAIAFDDIGAVAHWTDPRVGLLDRTLLDTTANRWRPVFSVFFALEGAAFGEDYVPHFVVDLVLAVLVVLGLAVLVRWLTGSAALAVAVGAVATTTHFAYYQLTRRSARWRA